MTKVLSFLVSGGDFRRTDGCLSFVDLDVGSGRLTLKREIWIKHPRPDLAVPGKGITGLCVDRDTAWACFSNLIACIRLPDAMVIDLIENEGFNDLHQMELYGSELLVANTGNESVDTVSLHNRTVARLDLLGTDLRALRKSHSQVANTEPHLHHVSSVAKNADGDLIVGLGRQARILNTTTWSWVGPRMHAPIHDVQVDSDGATWCTTVDGVVHRINERMESWQICDARGDAGWTRGLALCDEGMLVGMTAIRDSNRDYYRMITRSNTSQADACLVWSAYGNGASAILGFPGGSFRKLFTVCRLTQT
jgi:hypothetical protein